MLQLYYVCRDRRQLIFLNLEGRHAFIKDALRDHLTHRFECCGARPADVYDTRTVAASSSVRPMTADATRLVLPPARFSRLSTGIGDHTGGAKHEY